VINFISNLLSGEARGLAAMFKRLVQQVQF
jgi:hypothetical protein